MHPKRYYYGFILDRTREYTFRFKEGRITVEAESEAKAKILAQAEAIKRGWNHEILTVMTMEELQELINDKFNEIFHAYQETTENPSGDISPVDILTLDIMKKHLADFIVKVCNN